MKKSTNTFRKSAWIVPDVFSVPWFSRGSGRLYFGIPDGVGWHSLWMILVSLCFTASPCEAGTSSSGTLPVSELIVPLTIIGGYLILALGIGPIAYRISRHTAEVFYLAERTIGTSSFCSRSLPPS